MDAVDPGFTHPRAEHCPQVMYDRQLAYFVDCIAHGRLPNPGAAAGVVNMQIVDAAYRSAQSGKVVTILKEQS